MRNVNKIQRHEELCKQIHEVYVQKNTAYGDSFGKSFEDWGIAAAAIRLSDKWNRFVNLAKHSEIDKGDESIKDTLTDMANYALMTVMELEKKNE